MKQVIESLEQLKALAAEGPIQCTIKLSDFAKTHSAISYFSEGFPTSDRTDVELYHWDVFQGSGDCYLEIADDQELEETTSIVWAISVGNLLLD